MPVDFNVTENVSTLFEKLENFLKSKTVVGEAIKIGETTLIPFITVSFGLGAGSGDGTDSKGSKGVGGGSGVGAKAAPTAVLVIKGDQIELLPIKKSGGLDKLIEMVPGIVNKLKDEKCCEKETSDVE
jgi:uncharacterized spore protein YtfJ